MTILQNDVINGNDAEFLLKGCADGKFRIRIGQVWKLPKLRGSTALLLDYDNCTKVSRRAIRSRIAATGLRCLRILSKPSPSGRGMHCVAYVQGCLSRFQIVALQAILESDPKREANNFRRAMMATDDWQDNWNVLFNKSKKFNNPAAYLNEKRRRDANRKNVASASNNRRTKPQKRRVYCAGCKEEFEHCTCNGDSLRFTR